MADVIRFVLGNFTLTLLVIGLVAAGISLLRKPRPWSKAEIAEALLSYFVLFSVGVSFLYNFVMHVFFGEMAAGFIGWANSPFQAEVGYASLGFALLGFLAFWRGHEMRLAAVLAIVPFLWGAAVGHIRDLVATGNTAPGNAGIMLYSDILLPVIGFGLLWLARDAESPSSPAASR